MRSTDTGEDTSYLVTDDESDDSSGSSGDLSKSNGSMSDVDNYWIEDGVMSQMDFDDLVASATRAGKPSGVDPIHLSKIWRISP